MACLSNTPSFTYVSVQNMVIGYKNIFYNIKNMYSNDKYFYWDKNESPYELKTSNTMLESKEGLFLVIINDKGTFILPNQQEISINFDNNSGEDNHSSLSNIVEKINDIERKYTSINQTVDGITKTIGILRNDLGSSADIYTKIKQTANEIELLAQELNKEYSDSNRENELREKIVAYSISLSTVLSDFIIKMRDVFADALVSDEENYELINEMNKIESEKDSFFIYVDELIDVMEGKRETENANLLKSEKESLDGALKNFEKTFWEVVEDKIVTPTETSILIGLASTCRARLNDLKKTCSDFLFIGIGGTIYEEISKLNIEKDKILMSLNSITTSMRSSLSLEKSSLQAQFDDILVKLSDLDKWIEDISADGTITVMERNLLNEKMKELETESNDLTEKYNVYFDTLNLSEDEFSQMKKEFLEYVRTYNNFVNTVNQVCDDNFFNEIEKIQVITALEKYRATTNSFNSFLNKMLTQSEKNKYMQEIDNAKGEFNIQIQDVGSKLDELDTTIGDTFLDNIIDTIERTSIETSLNNLTLQENEVTNQYNRIILKACMNGDNTERKTLDEKYNAFKTAYDNICAEVNRILNKSELVTDEDKASVDSLYRIVLTTIGDYTQAANSALIYISENEATVLNNAFTKDLQDVNKRIDNIEVGYDDTFADNVIDQAERKEIASKRKILEIQNTDVQAQYTSLSKSKYITDKNKAILKTSYDTYVSKYTALNTAIDNVLAKTEFIDNDDRTSINTAIDELSIALSDFINKSNTIIEGISSEQTKLLTEDYNNRINALELSMTNINTTVEDAISDNIVDKSEKNSLKSLLKELELSKIEFENRYIEIYKDENLSAFTRAMYKHSYNQYKNAYNNYVGKINNIINAEGKITTNLKNEYETAYNNYEAKLDALSKCYQESISNIIKNTKENLESSISKEVREVEEALSSLSDSMEDIFDDAVLTDAEKTSIRNYFNGFKIKKNSIDTKYNSILGDLSKDSKARLTEAYNIYNTKYNALCTTMEDILARTDMLSSVDRDVVNNCIEEHNTALKKYSVIYLELIEESTKNFVDKTKQELENNINDINNTISELQTNLDGVFKDGILSDAEKLSIKQSLQALQTEKLDIDADYGSIYNNGDLVDKDDTNTPKTNLKNAYDTYISTHTALVQIINNLLLKEGIIDDDDRNEINVAMAKYRNALSTYKTKVNEAIDAISSKKINDERSERIQQYQSINTEIGKITTTVGNIYEDLDNYKSVTDEALSRLTPTSIIDIVREAKEEDGTVVFAKQSTLTQTINDFTLKFTDINSKIENNITTVSSEGITVKMYNESSFDNDGNILDGESPIARTNINGRGLYIFKESDNTPIAYFTLDQCFISNLNTNKINGANMIKSTANTNIPKNWYVAPAETGDGSGKNESNKSDSINSVINTIKEDYGTYLNNEDIVINIESGTYKENINIEGFLGYGSLTLNYDKSAILYGTTSVKDNTPKIVLEGNKTLTSTDGAIIYSYEDKQQDTITVDNSYCQITGFKAKNVSSTETSYYGIFAKYINGARGIVGVCDLLYYESGVLSQNASHVCYFNTRGKTKYRREAIDGGMVVSGGMIPSTVEKADSTNRGFIYQTGTLSETDTSGWYNQSSSGGSGGSTTQIEDTKTFTLINLKSIPEGTGLATSGFSGKIAQGRYSSYKKHRGKATLPQEALDFLASAKTIESISLTCHRLSTSHGVSGAVPYPRMRFGSTSTGSYSEYYTNSSIKFARGDTKTIPISSTSIKNALLNGANELQFYVGDDGNPQNQYSHYDGLKLKITITT